MFSQDPMCIPRCTPECQRVLTEKDVEAGWAICKKCFSHLKEEEQHPLLEIFKTASSCIYPGCFGIPEKDAGTCTATDHHLELARIHRWSSEEVDKLIKMRFFFDTFRSLSDFSEVHGAMHAQYKCAIDKLETGNSLKPGKRRSEPRKKAAA